jgi:hypothetical protein
MNRRDTLRTVLGAPYHKSVMLLGERGIGKSSLVYEAASIKSIRYKRPFQVLDFRLCSMELGDLMGLQRHVDKGEVTRSFYEDGKLIEKKILASNVTIHDVAEWFPTDMDSYGYLFLDEMFKAPTDVQNVVQEISLDYRFHMRPLPENWWVISANNDNLALYRGSFPDPALYSRWLKIKMKLQTPEWLAWAKAHGVHPLITLYLENNPTDLITEIQQVGEIAPDPRSWTFLSDWIIDMTKQGDDVLSDQNYFMELAKGYVGDSIAINLGSFLKKKYKVHQATEFINNMTSELEQEVRDMEPTDQAFYSTRVVSYIVEKKGKINPKQSDNIFRFVKCLKREEATGFWGLWTSKDRGQAVKWYRENEKASDYLYGITNKDDALKPVGKE